MYKMLPIEWTLWVLCQAYIKYSVTILKGYSTFFLEIGSFYNSPRVKHLSFTVF